MSALLPRDYQQLLTENAELKRQKLDLEWALLDARQTVKQHRDRLNVIGGLAVPGWGARERLARIKEIAS